MARTRSSAYGNALGQIPDWVFGGEFGDISNLLNKRDQAYEQTQNAEITNDRNQIRLEDEQRQADFEEELRKRDIFGGNQDTPPTLRDMYGRVRDVATEFGNVDYALEMEKRLKALQDAQDREARQKIKEQREDEEYAWRKERRGKSESGGSSDDEIKGTATLIGPDGSPELVKKSEYNAKIKAGYRDPDIENALLLNPTPSKKSSGASGSWSLSDLMPYEDSPMVTPSPTPLAKGDTARQTPAPTDQVALITRKRAKAVKGN